MKIILNITIIFSLIFGFQTLSAYESNDLSMGSGPYKGRNYIDITGKRQSIFMLTVGGGVHLLKYDQSAAASKPNAGVHIKFDYIYKFSSNWGVLTGLGIVTTFGQSNISNIFTETKIDEDKDEYILTSTINLTEKQTFYHLQIPVMAYCELPVTNSFSISFRAGVNVNIPIYAAYKVESGSVTSTAYYPEFDLELDDVSWLGYGVNNDFSSKGKINAMPNVSAVLEVGMNFYGKGNFKPIYVGLYADFSLHSMIKKSSDPLFADALTYTGILNSNRINGVNFQFFGLKVGIPLYKTKFRYGL